MGRKVDGRVWAYFTRFSCSEAGVSLSARTYSRKSPNASDVSYGSTKIKEPSSRFTTASALLALSVRIPITAAGTGRTHPEGVTAILTCWPPITSFR